LELGSEGVGAVLNHKDEGEKGEIKYLRRKNVDSKQVCEVRGTKFEAGLAGATGSGFEARFATKAPTVKRADSVAVATFGRTAPG
jgi:hypothetical protein